MIGDDIRRAIAAATPLSNPRLSEVEWDDVAAALAAASQGDERCPQVAGRCEKPLGHALLTVCDRDCTSSCHADDCEHHGHLPYIEGRDAALRDALIQRVGDAIGRKAALDTIDAAWRAVLAAEEERG